MSVLTLPSSSLTYPQACHFTRQHMRPILSLAKRIATDGLLNPITVTKNGNTFTVLDGRKRLAAIHLLEKRKQLPRSLTAVPCMDAESLCHSVRPLLKTDAEFVSAVQHAYAYGEKVPALALRFDCPQDTITQALSLDQLNPQISDYFRSGHLSLEQAAAFATLPNPDAQWRLLQELGPFTHADDVIAAILSGDTVIDMPDGDVMILPSRDALPRCQRSLAA